MTTTPLTGGNRRRFLKGAATVMAVPAAATLAGGLLHGTAFADTSTLPDFAPVPPTAFGPPLNADGYFVGRIAGNLYWVTNSSYQAMFLSTTQGIVLVDAPPTIGRNLLRAIDSVTKANGRPSKVTHLVYSHFHADHIAAAGFTLLESEPFGSIVHRGGLTYEVFLEQPHQLDEHRHLIAQLDRVALSNEESMRMISAADVDFYRTSEATSPQ